MNWPLRPEKTFFGARECRDFGHVANEKGIRLAEHNLKPIQDMVPPRDRKELRSVMGFFGVHRTAIKGVCDAGSATYQAAIQEYDLEVGGGRGKSLPEMQAGVPAKQYLGRP
jgi:hypothetical protein